MLEFINNITVINRAITQYQALIDSLNPGQDHVFNLGRYKIIGALCEVLIPFEKRRKAYKLALKTEPRQFLVVLSLKTFLVWVLIKRIVVKTPFIKLKEGFH